MTARTPNIRDAIQREMDRRAWTKYRLAKEAGISATVLGRFIAGRGISIPNLESVLTVLELELRRVR